MNLVAKTGFLARQRINTVVNYGTQMTQIIMINYDFISVNLPDLRYPRSIFLNITLIPFIKIVVGPPKLSRC